MKFKSAKGVNGVEERKLKILRAVVDEYITTGEPVGSKALMKYVNASSATIRNEMAELEKQGYLEQPHTSAGRVPTYIGYRLYVDSLLTTNPLSDDEISMLDAMLPSDNVTEGELVEAATMALAELTNCAAVVSNSAPKFSVISKVEVIPTGKRLYVLLMVTSSGAIKNKVCRLEFDLTNEQLAYFANIAKENLEGISLDELSDELVEKITTAMGTYMMTLSPLVSAICEMSRDLTGQEVFVRGEKNLIGCKDFEQTEIIEFLEQKNELAKFLDESFSGLQVLFSPDNGFVINNSSMIVSPFTKKGKNVGSLGIIGPMRLDYAKVIPYIEYFTKKISELLSADSEDDERED